MSETAVLAIGTPGLTGPDLDLRLYRDGVSSPTEAAAVTVTDIGAGRYRVSNIPTVAVGTWVTLTWEYPAGVGGALRYPEQDGAPPNVVVPLKVSGVTAAALNLQAFKDGVVQPVTFSVVEVPGSNGDYVVSGWPRDAPGAWTLSWSYAGFFFSLAWRVRASAFVEILARQRPFPFNTDENGRVLFSCNYDALARAPLGDFEQEIVDIIVAAGLGTFGTDLFVGPQASLTGPGPITEVIDTGGREPEETHDGKRLERLSCQIVVRAGNSSTRTPSSGYLAARQRALAVWRELDGTRNYSAAA